MAKNLIRKTATTLAQFSKLSRELEKAQTPREVLVIEVKLDAIERAMREAGLYDTKQIRPVNEARMFATWKLGRLLAQIERGSGPGRGKKDGRVKPTFSAFIKDTGLKPGAAKQAQRIGAMPEPELQKAFEQARELDILNTYSDLITRARSWWYQASRKKKHEDIADRAAGTPAITIGDIGPFPLIYADPPWKFEIYSPKGLERTPDQHYPTLSDDEIKNFKVQGQKIETLAHRVAALLLWCTSSNLVRALAVMEAWDFEFKSCAVWVKDKSGLGLVFRNRHELLLYGTRGKMPGPQFQPSSVFEYPRGRHSAKPPEVRKAIEKMYPDFDETSRIELFARERVKGWATHGYEANNHASE